MVIDGSEKGNIYIEDSDDVPVKVGSLKCYRNDDSDSRIKYKNLEQHDKWIKDKLKNYNYSFVICPDHTNTRKPDPSGLLLACKLTNSDPKLSMYIGDHKVDIEAGKNAGMKTIAASYGYCNISSEKDWGASMFVTKPQELKKLIF